MPDEIPSPPPAPPNPPAPQPATQFHIGEEFGTAKKNLPPVKIVAIGVGVVAVVAIILALAQRPHSATTGSIDDIVSVEVPDQNMVMVAINVSFQNNGLKPYWIHTIKAGLDTSSGNFTDAAASPADFDRYYQAFPTLKQHALAPLEREAKINPGGRIAGTIIVIFPVTPQDFANRKSLSVTIQPYDQPVPLVLTK
ncbi:MAG: hypothetical protein WB711_25245 [Terriglobales bacterium]